MMGQHMSEAITGQPERWPHLEACYDLARRAAEGFAPPAARPAAFTAARWGLHMGMAIAALDTDFAEAVRAELEDYDLARDGLEAATHARWSMLQDMDRLRALVRRLSEDR